MKKDNRYYAAIDLHSNNLMIAIVNAEGRRIKDARLFCEMHEVEKFRSFNSPARRSRQSPRRKRRRR
jgi:hypothetical protein